jgi:hypothetical protein
MSAMDENLRGARAGVGGCQDPKDSALNRRESAMESAATIRSAFGRMELAQCNRPPQGYGGAHTPGETACPRSDRTAGAKTGSLESHGEPDTATAELGHDSDFGDSQRAWADQSRRDQRRLHRPVPVCRGTGRVSLPWLSRQPSARIFSMPSRTKTVGCWHVCCSVRRPGSAVHAISSSGGSRNCGNAIYI